MSNVSDQKKKADNIDNIKIGAKETRIFMYQG